MGFSFLFTSGGILQKNVLWWGVKEGLERQRLKGYVAFLPSSQCDSPFPGSNVIFFYFYAYEFRKQSKPLNPGKNIKNCFIWEQRNIFLFSWREMHKNKGFRFYWYSDQIVSFFVAISILNQRWFQLHLSSTFNKFISQKNWFWSALEGVPEPQHANTLVAVCSPLTC